MLGIGTLKHVVSIVSIQTDQSRRGYASSTNRQTSRVSIVSIQTDQSRHVVNSSKTAEINLGFNRINPNRSIPTVGFLAGTDATVTKVSIVSIQTDQSRLWLV